MKKIAATVFALVLWGSFAYAQAPEKILTFTVTGQEFGKVWDALGEQKAKDVFLVMFKLNSQIIPQLQPPAPAPAPPKDPPKDPQAD